MGYVVRAPVLFLCTASVLGLACEVLRGSSGLPSPKLKNMTEGRATACSLRRRGCQYGSSSKFQLKQTC